ncbi:MAG: HD domain-containing protein [Candidatus Aminicenantes bacterium]|nr:HD domain-containing protein [Candidatus Aminicenantes bacterium]
MLNKIKVTLIHLLSAIQTGKIYSPEHPKYHEFIEQAHNSLQEVLKEKKELVIGIVEDELAWEDEIFFDLSQKLKSLVLYLQERGIERIYFNQSLNKNELEKFITFLITPKADLPEDPHEYLSAQGVKNIRAGKIRTLASDQKKKSRFSVERIKQYENSLKTVSQSFDKLLNEEDIDYLDLRFNILNVMENFMGRHQELLNLISIKKKDLVTFVHLLNVSILSMYISSKLGFSKDDVLDLGIAALFHDIGKISISLRILKKKSKLVEDEFLKIQDHSILGTKILTRYIDMLGILPIVVSFEHHMRYDLKGYPKVHFPHTPHLASYIVSLCDVYDALAQRRTYKRDYPPNEIYNIMMKEKGKLFDPKLLVKFFKITGVWPIGTIVSLSNRSIAFVREANERDIFRPVVEVISPKNRKGTIDLLKNKDISIKKSLNPFTEGKKYLDMLEAAIT